ncbi:hypothetical protein BEN49_05775 [Hymenobacter coccineus]|uniref:Uncharacterized protein n=1 Tax=Hymenobacter coccineus TaxID=1908235 RepID=A0A1G1TJE4_9BACT|nr:hypothetical protein [Hymenobacter coccineus]OGX90989.1 hypothetical protein BEN49_05775 [Hymenobacter coccineus]
MEVAFELVGRTMAKGRVPPVEVEVGVEVAGSFQSGPFEAGKRAAVRQQFGFERAPTGFGRGIVVGVARPAVAGQCLGFFDARPAR